MNKPGHKVTRIIFDSGISIMFALKKMDELNVKLLILQSKGKFDGLISIGDIQRAIINNIDLNLTARSIVRESIYYASPKEDIKEIKARMLRGRDECMPIVDSEGNIVDAIFWDDIFENDVKRNESTIDVPIVIMAGGLGTRMKPLTNVIPKPLIPIGEHTVSEEIIANFTKYGAKNFYMSVNYKADIISHYFSTIKSKEYSLKFFKEDKPLGTAGSLHLLKGKLTSTFFVTNCDVMIDQDMRDVLTFHRDNHNDLTMVCSLKSVYIPYGTVTTGENGKLIDMEEKPEIRFMINTGVYLLEPSLLEEIPNDRVFHVTELIQRVNERTGKVAVFPISEKQYHDIGEWDFYIRTIEYLKQINKQ